MTVLVLANMIDYGKGIGTASFLKKVQKCQHKYYSKSAVEFAEHA